MRAALAGIALALLTCAGLASSAPVAPVYPAVTPGRAFQFPADHGAHPEFRTEWWYVTGWLKTPDGEPLGFQVTFFRTRPAVDQRNPSAFAAKQVLFAHVALSDPTIGHLLHDQRAARAGFGLAQAATSDADIALDDWSLKRGDDNHFRAKIHAASFTLDLDLAPTESVLLQGEAGYSRKGPRPESASYYYSMPQLQVAGRVTRGTTATTVTGTAWLDHEWSSTLLDPGAVGWDWLGLNLDDGGALMAFQIRDAAGRALWAGASYRPAHGTEVHLAPADIAFATKRNWRSARTNTLYPVERVVTIQLPDGARQWHLTPLFDDQELDSRSAGGPLYWEGAVSAHGAFGYLELTGYAQPLKL